MRLKTVLLLGSTCFALSRLAAAERRRISFAGRVVLISGGSRGLGLELARQFVREGARVALIARAQFELDRAVTELQEMGGRVMRVVCDITQREQVNDAVHEVITEFGRIDVLVNNAGMIQVGPLEAMTEEDFEAAMDVHFRGPLRLMLGVIPHLRRQGGGRMVNIVSIGGRVAVPHLLPYSASKFALAGLSNGMRSELRRENIFVTTVFPGLMRTGSIYKAWFKGRYGREFAWFGTAGSLPFLSMNSTRAAAQIVNACRRGAAQLVVGLPAKVACLIHDLLPGTTAEAMAWVQRFLPGNPAANTGSSQRGEEAKPEGMPSTLTALSEAAAAQNNQTAAPPSGN